MRWFTALWQDSSTPVRIALIVTVAVVVLALVWLGVGDALATWLSAN